MHGEIIKKKDLPKNISLSQHLLEQCTELVEIDFFGVKYYIPLTIEINKVIKRGKFGHHTLIKNDALLQDIINAVYLQIRDTVGADIHSQLSQQIEEGFSKMFSLPLAKKIDDQLNKALPPPKEK